VQVVHLNDSRGGLASHRDHHARLGEGTIPLTGLADFLRMPSVAHTTVILETPFTMVGDGPDGAAVDAAADGEPDTAKASGAAQIDWDAERRRLFQTCELAGMA
jgi:hypothetical protein